MKNYTFRKWKHPLKKVNKIPKKVPGQQKRFKSILKAFEVVINLFFFISAIGNRPSVQPHSILSTTKSTSWPVTFNPALQIDEIHEYTGTLQFVFYFIIILFYFILLYLQ